jgi:glutamate 5-kinase
MRRVVIKLGSSVVANPDGELREDALAHICGAVADLHNAGEEAIVVTSGAIARGMRIMSMPRRPNTVGELQAASAVGQGKLYRAYDELLRERGVTSAQLLLTFFDMSARTHYLNARQTLETLLSWRVLPVINENDTTATDEISFGDNDFLAAQVAVLIGADELVLLTDIDGLYSADPRLYPDARLIEQVDDFAALHDLEIGHTTGPLGSGGMRSKVVAADMATAAGIATTVCNGLSEDALRMVLVGAGDRRAGEPAGERVGRRAGTYFPPREARYSSFKLWLKYAKPSRGRLIVDEGAARAVREGSASLLPVGIVDVQQEFDAGDAVDIVERRAGDAADAHTGSGQRAIAKGICNYSAAELRRVIGMKSADVRELLPRATEEAVHRDYLVLD